MAHGVRQTSPHSHGELAPRPFLSGSESRHDTTVKIVSGTVVDRTFAHSSNFSFYNIAHIASQGTIRPVRYSVLLELSHNLSFTFCPSTSHRHVRGTPISRWRAHTPARDMCETMYRNGGSFDVFIRQYAIYVRKRILSEI